MPRLCRPPVAGSGRPNGILPSVGDFPRDWVWIRDLSEGGQGFTFVVRRAGSDDPREYVLKRLKNPSREDYFEREITACERLSHPNILRIIEHGKTPKGKPYLITPFCNGGAIEKSLAPARPIEGLRIFQQICAGVAHAHSASIFHLDLKPANIFLQDGGPIVGDFGICYIEDGKYEMTSEGPRGSIYYCAPELRGPKIRSAAALSTSDVYSLGKVLHWIFSHEVFDGHEEDYGPSSGNLLADRDPSTPELTLIDELIGSAVRRDPNARVAAGLSNASDFLARVQMVLARIEAGGRVLDLSKPIKCLFCAQGTYQPLAPLPPRDQRVNFPDPTRLTSQQPDIYQHMRSAAEYKGYRGPGGSNAVGPLVLTCDYCGNVQEFRFDIATQAINNWKP